MSKGADNLEQKLGQFLAKYNLAFKKEVAIGKNKARYDFFIETSTPIALEFDGVNHSKPNAHFFKTTEAFDNYKKNDNAKNELSRLGKVHLIRTTNENLTLTELEKLFEGYESLLEEGVVENKKKSSYEERAEASKKAASDYRHRKYLEFAEKKRAAAKIRKESEAELKREKRNNR